MRKPVACLVLGVTAGILVNLFSSWAERPGKGLQELLPARMTTKGIPTDLQSAVLSVTVMIVLAFMCAFVISTVAKKRLDQERPSLL